MHKTRITMNMSTMDAVLALCEGNPGAVSVVAQILRDDGKIDPDAAMGGLGALLMLDTYGIYGSRIWMLYKDICGQDLTKTMGALRAMQLGIVSSSVVDRAIGTDMTPGDRSAFDLEDTLAKVRERLPRFGG